MRTLQDGIYTNKKDDDPYLVSKERHYWISYKEQGFHVLNFHTGPYVREFLDTYQVKGFLLPSQFLE